ncbi:hypothetical protein Tco_1077581, partial [Tanacetum coccineum]
RRSKRKDTEVPQPSGPTINLADKAVNEEMDNSLVRVATTASSLEVEHGCGNIIKTRSKATPNEPSSIGTSLGGNTPRSDEDSLKLKELMELYTNLQNRVIDLEKTKTSQAQEITSLKRRVKRLEKKNPLGLKYYTSTHFDVDTDMFGVHDLVGDEVVVESEVAVKAASTISVSAAIMLGIKVFILNTAKTEFVLPSII